MGAGAAPRTADVEPGVPAVAGGCGLRELKGSGDLEGNDCGEADVAGGEGVGEVGVVGRGRGAAGGGAVERSGGRG